MRTRKHSARDDADTRMNELLDRARRRVWTGPDHSPRVEEHLRGIAMSKQSKFTLTRSALILIGVGGLAGGSLAAAVTHTLMSWHGVLVAPDGTEYDVELTEVPGGATGSFVTDDGTTFDIDVADQGDAQQVTVDVMSPTGGISTVILDDGTAPSVQTEPGQTAQITIGTIQADPMDSSESSDE